MFVDGGSGTFTGFSLTAIQALDSLLTQQIGP